MQLCTNKLCGLLTLKSVWESHVTWATPVQSFVFLGLLVFEFEPMYATSDRRTTDADDRLMPPPPLRGRGHNKLRNNSVDPGLKYRPLGGNRSQYDCHL